VWGGEDFTHWSPAPEKQSTSILPPPFSLVLLFSLQIPQRLGILVLLHRNIILLVHHPTELGNINFY
jgi:hypothetical protein